MTDEQVLGIVDAAFSKVPRPEHFTNHKHCPECAEHDELMRSRTPETLKASDVENPGWNPICFLTPEGFAYYFPALARIALSDEGVGFLTDLVPFHLGDAMLAGDKLQSHSWLKALNQPQKAAIREYVLHVAATRQATMKRFGVESKELEKAIGFWDEACK